MLRQVGQRLDLVQRNSELLQRTGEEVEMAANHGRVRDELVGGPGFPSVQDSLGQFRTLVNPDVSSIRGPRRRAWGAANTMSTSWLDEQGSRRC